jgi:hypothetical protein
MRRAVIFDHTLLAELGEKGRSHPRERPFLRFPIQRAQTRPSIQEGIDMLTQDQIQVLKVPFPPEALSSDTSRGFELTSIKAAQAPAVIERLNEAFGPCGVGWRYVHSPFEELHTDNGRAEIVTEVALQYRFPATNDCAGCDQVVWDAQANDWAFRNGSLNHDWSEPIFACGGKGLGKGGAIFTDARKPPVTDGLTQAASMIGVGHQVFKGLVRVGSDRGRAGGDPGPRHARPRGAERPGNMPIGAPG